jgi:DNA-binding beta-propeller fold protein YncE
VDQLLVRTDEGFRALDIHGGEASIIATGTIASPDWSALFGASPVDGGSKISGFATWSGTRLARFRVDAALEPSVLSGSGRLLALTEPRGEGATPWLPSARSTTRLAVVDSEDADPMRTFQLRGNFEPEAFAANDRQLFMIEYIPAMAPDRYRVRRLNLKTGAVRPIGRTKLSAPEQMRGTGRMQVLAPDGNQLYTLYTQQGPNYAHGEPEHHSPDQNAFVHVLNLRHGWAHCIDLAMPFGMGSATASALDVSEDGRNVFVADWTNGALARIDTQRLRVRKMTVVELGTADDQTFVEVSDDGSLFVAGNREVAVIDQDSLTVVDRWSFSDEVMGLALSSDGESVYVGQSESIAVVDREAGEVRRRVAAPGITSIAHVLE